MKNCSKVIAIAEVITIILNDAKKIQLKRLFNVGFDVFRRLKYWNRGP